MAKNTKPLIKGIIPLAKIEKQHIQAAIRKCGGDMMLAAFALGIGKTTIYRRVHEYEKG